MMDINCHEITLAHFHPAICRGKLDHPRVSGTEARALLSPFFTWVCCNNGPHFRPKILLTQDGYKTQIPTLNPKILFFPPQNKHTLERKYARVMRFYFPHPWVRDSPSRLQKLLLHIFVNLATK